MKTILFACAASAAVAAGALAAPPPRHMTPDDLTKIVRITDPRISPDGRRVAFVVSRANLKDDRWDPELEVVDVATRQVAALTHERLGVASPRWSPDGGSLAFIADDKDKTAQVFVLPMSGGEAAQVTHSKTPVELIAWRPDGAALAYAAPDEAAEKTGEAKYEDAFEVGFNNYTERSRRLPTHLWVVSLADGAARRISHGDWSLPVRLPPTSPPSQLIWTKDARSLVFVKAASPITGDNASSRLAMIDVASGEAKALTPPVEAVQMIPVISPDGDALAYDFPRDGKMINQSEVWVTPIGASGPAAGPVPATQDLDHAVALVGWADHGRALIVEGHEGTREVMWRQPLGGGPASEIPLGDLTPTGQGATSSDGAIVFTATTPDRPAELFWLGRPGDAPVALTHLQTATDGAALGRQETVRWKSDQFEVTGVLTYPPGYAPGKKLPLVLYIHGGPVAASLASFSPAPQILAAHGWLVLEPNYRGSDDGGEAFQTAIWRDAGAGPGRDILAGVKAVEAKGIVDESRVAVSGWSYGGMMTSWMIGAYPGVWKAAVAGAPVTDLVDQYTLSDNNAQRATAYGPSPFLSPANMASYAAQSPITNAWRIRAPTLIMSDVGDWRVTTTQAYKLFHALKDNHVPVSFIAYPVPGHSPSDPIRGRDVWRRWTAWLAQYLDAPGAG